MRYKEHMTAFWNSNHTSSLANTFTKLLRPHKQYHATTTVPQESSPPEHNWKISHPCRIHCKQPLKQRHHISKCNLWHPHKDPPSINHPLIFSPDGRQNWTLQHSTLPSHKNNTRPHYRRGTHPKPRIHSDNWDIYLYMCEKPERCPKYRIVI